MTVTCFELDEGKIREFKKMTFFIDDGSVVDVRDGRAEEHSAGFKIFDDMTKETTIIYNKKLMKLVMEAVDYEKYKQDSVERQEKILKRVTPQI